MTESEECEGQGSPRPAKHAPGAPCGHNSLPMRSAVRNTPTSELQGKGTQGLENCAAPGLQAASSNNSFAASGLSYLQFPLWE